MIEILGITLAAEQVAAGSAGLFALSEIIGRSKLKSNGVVEFLLHCVDFFKAKRTEEARKIDELSDNVAALYELVKNKQ